MTLFVPIALFGWIPISLVMFLILPPRRAAIAAFLGAWLFLPMAGYRVPGFTSYTKMTAASLGVVLAMLLFDSRRLSRFRLRWFDLPVAVWSFCPLVSSMTNGLGAYDGASASLEQLVEWGLPYIIGRLYFTDQLGLQELASGILISGLVYIPLCLFEVRMSPQLHTFLYGFYQHSWAQAYRFGGWRPTVFMSHGLAVAMWMAMASLLGTWFWMTGSLRRVCGTPVSWLVFGLVVTTVLCKSVNAMVLLVVGLAALAGARRWGSSALFWCLIMAAPTYMVLRASGTWSGSQLVSIAETVINKERADSLKVRLDNETMLAEKAMQRPAFGWGRWGRNRITDEEGKDVCLTDGMWVIFLGINGMVGLVSFYGMLLLPVGVLLWTVPTKQLVSPAMVGITGLSVILVLYGIDSLFNSMPNPVYAMVAGGLCTVAGLPASVSSKTSCVLGDLRAQSVMGVRVPR